jgi:cytochrome c oxidase subunit 4
MSARLRSRLRGDAAILLGALILLLLNIGAAWLPLGRWHAAATLGLCASQALLILLFWMDLKSSQAVIRYCVIVPLAWLLLLIGLTFADLLTRQPIPPPW